MIVVSGIGSQVVGEIDEARFAQLNLEILKVTRLPGNTSAFAVLLTEWGLRRQAQECFWVIAHDANANIHTVVEVARGAHTNVEVHLPTLLSAVLMSGSEAFAVAHNHPTMTASPSLSDHDLTHKIMDAANACGLCSRSTSSWSLEVGRSASGTLGSSFRRIERVGLSTSGGPMRRELKTGLTGGDGGQFEAQSGPSSGSNCLMK